MEISQQELMVATAVDGLQKYIPLNDIGLPQGFYRPDLLPFHDYVPPGKSLGTPVDIVEGQQLLARTDDAPKETTARTAGFPTDELEEAFTWLSYDEGYPTQQNGKPFWDKLPYEPMECHDLFKRYLSLGSSADSPPRAIASLGDANDSVFTERTRHQSILYYWKYRTQAFDIYSVAERQRAQDLRAIELNDQSYFQAQHWMERLKEYIGDEEEFWGMMTPKVALDFLKQLHVMQRLAVGMPASTPPTTRTQGQPFSAEFRKTAVDVGEQEPANASASAADDAILVEALEDIRTTEAMQDLILKVHKQPEREIRGT